MELASFTITPSGSQEKSLPSIPINWGFASLEVLDPRRGMLPPKYNNSIELEVGNASWALWAPHAFETKGT